MYVSLDWESTMYMYMDDRVGNFPGKYWGKLGNPCEILGRYSYVCH